jgi:hypothetical protein
MKRDMDLVRKLLIEIERCDTGSGQPMQFSDFCPDQQKLYGHLKLLDEASLIEGHDLPSTQYMPSRLTWSGHEFLSAVRDENIWTKTKDKLSEVSGAVTLDIVKAIALSFLKAKLGLPL